MQQYFAKNKSLTLKDGDYHRIKNVMKMKISDLIKEQKLDCLIQKCTEVGVDEIIMFLDKNTKNIKKYFKKIISVIKY